MFKIIKALKCVLLNQSSINWTKLCFILILIGYSPFLFAWEHEIEIGYGSGKEVEQKYNNDGLVINAKLYKFPKLDNTLYATIDATLSRLHAHAEDHRYATIAALSPSFRAYFHDPCHHCVRPYLQASFGPAYLSNRTLGQRTQGAHFAFQTSLQAGIEAGGILKSFDVNIRLTHYCNAGLFHPNQGFNLLPILSIGYQF